MVYDWIFEPHVWIILGLSLIICDIFLGTYFIIPIGIASIMIAIFLQFEIIFSQDEKSIREILIYFSLLSVFSIFLLKFLFRYRRQDRDDVNNY